MIKQNETIIDLRSDTVTQPTAGMLQAMIKAEIGDDVFAEDPTINHLEQYAAAMFGMEDALFCPSGTMTNQIAIKIHTQPGSEVICHRLAHIYNYEGGGIAFHSGASVRLLPGLHGIFTAKDVVENINDDNVHYPVTSLVAVENTVNKGGGAIFPFSELQAIGKVCKQHGLRYHLDGARIFNALAETGESPQKYGKLFDTISFCFSKGLGAPVGSVLLGSKENIKQARRIRKVMGGGMRQAGYLAAAALYALQNHRERLPNDHRRAKQIGEKLRQLNVVEEVVPVETNIVISRLHKNISAPDFVEQLRKHNILCLALNKQTIRMVTHLNFTENMLNQVEKVFRML